MSISFESIVFLQRKMLKSSPFNNHFTQHFSPEPDAHCSGRCPLQIALQRSLTLLSKRKPQLSTWVLLKTLVPRCVFTPKYGALECSYLNRVVPSVFTNPQMYTSHNPFVLLQDVAGAFWPRGQDGPQEKPEFPVASQAPRLAPLTLANRRCSRQIFFMGKKIQ